MFDAMVMG